MSLFNKIFRVLLSTILGITTFIAFALLNFKGAWNGNIDILAAIKELFEKKLGYIGMLMGVGIFLLFLLAAWRHNINDIHGKRVGDGQYGNAKWMDSKEIKKTFYLSSDIGNTESGFIIGRKKKFIQEKRDFSVMVVSPPGKGKTDSVVEPNMYHSFSAGDFVLATDTKGDLYEKMAPYAIEQGYKVINLDFRKPMQYNKYNFLSIINDCMDKVLLSESKTEKIIYRAKAQKYAKILAEQIIGLALKSGSAGQNQYFYDTAEGILAALILLTAEYADENERHIVSVFKLIQEQAQASEGESDESGKTKLFHMMEKLSENDKAKWLGAAGAQADIRVALNVFSTALSSMIKFIDDEMEQMICFQSDFNVEELKENHKVAIFLNMPEENPTRHFAISLFINTLNMQLIEMASEYKGNKLPFVTRLYIDEFGTLPAVKNIDKSITAARSRGIYYLVVIQSVAQLQERYGDKNAKIIVNAFQILMFSGLGVAQKDDAKLLSEMVGDFTVLSGSVSRSGNKLGDRGNLTESMMARRLITVQEIINLKMGEFVTIRGGENIKSKMIQFSKVKGKSSITEIPKIEIKVDDIAYFSSDTLEKRLSIANSEPVESSDINYADTDGVIENVIELSDNETNPLLEEIYDVLYVNDSFDGLGYLMERNYSALIKALYNLHVNDKLDGIKFEQYKAFLKEKKAK